MLDSPKEDGHLERFSNAYVRWFTSSNNAITAGIQGEKDEELRLNQLASEAFDEAKVVIIEEARKKGSAALQEFQYLETIPANMRPQMKHFFGDLLLALLDDLKQ